MVQSKEQRKGGAAAGVLHSFAASGPVKARLANALQRPSTGIVDVTTGMRKISAATKKQSAVSEKPQDGSRRAAKAAGVCLVGSGTPQKEQHSLPWAGKAAFPDIGKCGSLGLRRHLPIMHRMLLLFLQIRMGIADSILHDCVCMAWDVSQISRSEENRFYNPCLIYETIGESA